jgi:hypothetical protein
MIMADVEKQMDKFNRAFNVVANLTGTERRRLISARVKNYGFIEKSLDIALANTEFNPPNFNPQVMAANYRQFEDARQFSVVLDQFQRAVSDLSLITSDTIFREALRIYGSLREQARNRVPGAAPLFEALQIYFQRRSRRQGSEPTIKELEHDFHALIRGKADGELIIENETPKVTGGKRTVVDKVRRGRAAAKLTESENSEQGTDNRGRDTGLPPKR